MSLCFPQHPFFFQGISARSIFPLGRSPASQDLSHFCRTLDLPNGTRTSAPFLFDDLDLRAHHQPDDFFYIKWYFSLIPDLGQIFFCQQDPAVGEISGCVFYPLGLRWSDY